MVTNGTIEFSRRIRTGDFEHKDAKVSLSFTVPDGADQRVTAETVGKIAVERALLMVGETTWNGPKAGQPIAGNAVAANPTARSSVVSAPAPAAASQVATPAAPSAGSDLVGNGVAVNPITTAATGHVAELTGATDTATTEEIITDARMVEEISAKNAWMLNHAEDDLARQQVPVALHALVANFVPPPAKVQAILQSQRAEFLERLAAL